MHFSLPLFLFLTFRRFAFVRIVCAPSSLSLSTRALRPSPSLCCEQLTAPPNSLLPLLRCIHLSSFLRDVLLFYRVHVAVAGRYTLDSFLGYVAATAIIMEKQGWLEIPKNTRNREIEEPYPYATKKKKMSGVLSSPLKTPAAGAFYFSSGSLLLSSL